MKKIDIDRTTDAPTLEPWRRRLFDAANLLERRGWAQNNFETSHGFCAFGAIREVAAGCGIRDAINALRLHINEPSVILWNDRPERTQAEVIAAMRAAALS